MWLMVCFFLEGWVEYVVGIIVERDYVGIRFYYKFIKKEVVVGVFLCVIYVMII